MSYQRRRPRIEIVVCDACGAWGAGNDWHWRATKRNRQGSQLHLCRPCRRSATWCDIHDQYHQATSLHRRPCRACGGLFTAQVRFQRKHCPSCQRALPPPLAVPASQAASWRNSMRAWIARWIKG